MANHVPKTRKLETAEQEIIHIRGNTKPNKEQSEIYNYLQIKQNPLGKAKTAISQIKKS